eukprot:10532337-Lingulodinium_polyedra.AAC.1
MDPEARLRLAQQSAKARREATRRSIGAHVATSRASTSQGSVQQAACEASGTRAGGNQGLHEAHRLRAHRGLIWCR